MAAPLFNKLLGRTMCYLVMACSVNMTLWAQEDTYTNPIMKGVTIADPYVLEHEGTFYLYGTTSASRGFKYWTSRDLIHWTEEGYALRKEEGFWGQDSFWAPEVIAYDHKFYLIYSSRGETMFGKGLRICIAVSDQPSGPFKELFAPLFDFGFSCIDGHIFIDSDGTPYLYYEKVGAVGEFWKHKGYLWGQIYGAKMTSDLSKITNEPVLCLYPSQPWEGLNSMQARSNEGMTVFKEGDVYYMTFSSNHFLDPNYSIGYATADTPLGLWTKAPENPVLRDNLDIGVSGPGHNGIVRLKNGDNYMVYHTHANFENPNSDRVLNLDRFWVKDGKLWVDGPTRSPCPNPRIERQ